jgi:hypothetical protein
MTMEPSMTIALTICMHSPEFSLYRIIGKLESIDLEKRINGLPKGGAKDLQEIMRRNVLLVKKQ